MLVRAAAKRPRGISTVEVLVGAALTLGTLATLFSVFDTQQRAMTAQGVYADSQNVTRTAVDLLGRELRMASFDPSGAALPPTTGACCPGADDGIVEAGPALIHFRQDLNGDGLLTGAAEDVTYDLVEGVLRRREGTGTPVALARGLTSDGLELAYFNGETPPVELVPTGSPVRLTTCQRNCVAKVRFTIRASLPNPNPDAPPPLDSVGVSEVAIRSRSLGSF